jgi:membrane protein DedA with SNARE-associated domain
MAMGAVVADGIVYFLGRFASELMLRRHWVDANRLVKTQESFSRHAVQAIIIARFIPGVRLVTYLAAGTVRYSIARFFFWLFVAGLIQGVIFLQAAHLIAQTILPYFHEKHTHLSIIAGIVVLLLAVHGLYLRHRRRVNVREAQKAAAARNEKS